MAHSTAQTAAEQMLLPFLASSRQRTRPRIPPHNQTPTSAAAALTVRRRAPNLRAMVLQYIGDCGRYGATADEVCHALDMLAQSATPRVNELAKAGEIVNSGRTRPTRSGRAAVVWIAAGNRNMEGTNGTEATTA